MRLTGNSLGFIINFLLGVAWATALIGAVSTFLSYYNDSFFFAIVSAFVASLPGLIAVLVLEHFITSKEKHLELKKQTALLEKLLLQKENNDLQ